MKLEWAIMSMVTAALEEVLLWLSKSEVVWVI